MTAHVVPLKTYYRIFSALVVLTVLTVAVAEIDLGALNTFVAVSIAVVKALLVLLYFMHVRYSSQLTWVYAAAGVIWLLILFALTLGDYVSRAWQGIPVGL